MEQVGLVTLQQHHQTVAMVRPLPQGKGIMEVLGLAQLSQAVEVVVLLLLEQIQSQVGGMVEQDKPQPFLARLLPMLVAVEVVLVLLMLQEVVEQVEEAMVAILELLG